MKCMVSACILIFVIFGLHQGIVAIKPTIFPSGEMVIQNGHGFNIICEDKGKLQFSRQKLSGKAEQSANKISIDKIDGKYTYTFTIKSARKEDTGWYACAKEGVKIQNDEQTMDHNDTDISWTYVYVNSSEPFAVMDSITTLKVVGGTRVVIPCRPTSSSVPVMLEVLHPSDGPKLDTMYHATIGFIVNDPTQIQDQNLYKCEINETEQKDTTMPKYALQVLDPERLENPVITQGTVFSVILGENMTLDCQITVPKGDSFSMDWNVPLSVRKIPNITELKFVRDEEDNRKKWKSELTIQKVGRSDGGQYNCSAKGFKSESSSSIEVQIWEPGNITGGKVNRRKLNESAILWCRVDGYSLKNFSWVKINNPENSEHFGIEDHHFHPNTTSVAMSLNFTSVTRDDNGTYECRAEDYNGNITNQTSLIVMEKPRVTINTVRVVDFDKVFLRWTIYDGNDDVETYPIQLMENGSERWEDYPQKLSKDTLAYVVEKLEKGAAYRFRITVRNAIGGSEPAYSQWVKTGEGPVFHPEPVVEKMSETSLKIRWNSLPSAFEDFIQYYELNAIVNSMVNRTREIPATETSYEFTDLIAGVKYEITISACNNEGKLCFATHKSNIIAKEVGQVGMWSGFGVALLVFVMMTALLCIRKHRDLASRKRFMIATIELFKVGKMDSLDPELDVADQAELLPYNKKWEFPRKQLTLGKILGSGAFGVVRKGQAKSIIRKNLITTVAVKMVRATDRLDHMTALSRELKILAHLGKHLNIVNLLGACTKRISYGELLVIVEFCQFGNLHDYLLGRRDDFIEQVDNPIGNIANTTSKTNSLAAIDSDINTLSSDNDLPVVHYDHSTDSKKGPTVTIHDPASDADYINLDQSEYYKGDFTDQDLRPIGTKDLLSWAWQVSRGMKYLSSRRVLHGDLAARNILLADRKVVKICDFGLAKSLYSDDIYKKEGRGPLPVKWMAIESIRDRVFSIKSDVWSFGVVLWEFFTLAETPYPGIENENVFRKLIDGFRMERPKYATEEIYNMMLRCWDAESSKRPSFGELAVWIEDLLEEKVKADYVDLDAPYAKVNAKTLADGEIDYLAMGPSENTPISTEPATVELPI